MIADLVMILNEGDKGGRRQRGRRFTAQRALAMLGGFALVVEAFGEHAPQPLRAMLEIVPVIAALGVGTQHAQYVVIVIVPLRRERPRPTVAFAEHRGAVFVVLENQPGRPPLQTLPQLAAQFQHEVRVRIVTDRVHGVETQAVEVVFLQPVQCVFDKEIAHFAAALIVEIDCGAPGRVVAFGEELRRVGMQEIAFRPEVVVDHVQHHRDPARMTGVDQAFERGGSAVALGDGERQYAVIAPVPATGALGHRHQFNRVDAKVDQVIQMRDHAVEVAGFRKAADVQLVEHRAVPIGCTPVRILPVVLLWIDDLAEAQRLVRLIAGCRIRVLLSSDTVAVATAGCGGGAQALVITVGGWLHRDHGAILEHQLNLLRTGRPQTKVHAPIGDFGASMQA